MVVVISLKNIFPEKLTLSSNFEQPPSDITTGHCSVTRRKKFNMIKILDNSHHLYDYFATLETPPSFFRHGRLYKNLYCQDQ